MNNATVQDHIHYLSQPVVAIVEKIPTIPELFQWNLIQQHKKTRLYTLNDVWNNSSSVTLGSVELSLTKDEQIQIIRDAQASIRSDIKDLDAEIRSLVSKNFKYLLWK